MFIVPLMIRMFSSTIQLHLGFADISATNVWAASPFQEQQLLFVYDAIRGGAGETTALMRTKGMSSTEYDAMDLGTPRLSVVGA